MKSGRFLLLLWTIVPILFSCNSQRYTDSFDKTSDRVWIGEKYWAVPLEEWRVNDGRIECIGNQPDMRVNILNTFLNGKGKLRFSVNIGIVSTGDVDGTAGIRLGITDKTDMDIRSLCYFGKGMNIGYNTAGFLFIDDVKTDIPEGFNPESFVLNVTLDEKEGTSVLTASIIDINGISSSLKVHPSSEITGIIALVNNHFEQASNGTSPKFWFDNLDIEGDMAEFNSDNSFGPILWTMYTLNDSTLKLSAQFPPIGENDSQEAVLQLKKTGEWTDNSTAFMEPESRIAVFRVDNWDPSVDVEYRVKYVEHERKDPAYYEGVIRKDPGEKELVMGGLTCQFSTAFPYRPVSENLAKLNPDILYFSGDQIYESNGGYGIIRYPADRAILNYLGKWYMFGWAFGDVMRDRPTICVPDDHEMFQGNLWGNSGELLTLDEWASSADAISGFVQPVEMVNVVMRTNCAHLPDPYDPTPMDNGIQVFYTDLVYGRTSFAIIGDRLFKSGPQNISTWEGRKDHIKFKLKDPSILEKEGLELLGKRQMEFLESWVHDWKGADMKVFLSQTILAYSTTHHGPDKMFLMGDLDSGGWPKTPRDEALNTIRKCFAFHICGDQHIPMQLQYGTDEFRDAGWVFCTPAISVGYERRFFPDELGWNLQNKPSHNLPNTGEFTDGFGNKNFMYAVGNPADKYDNASRYHRAQSKASGFGMIYFNKENGDITTEAWRFLTSENMNDPDDQFPGWPVTVNQLDNYSKKDIYYLNEIEIENLENPVVEVIDQLSGETIYILRLRSSSFRPFVFSKSKFKIKIGSPEKGIWQTIENLEVVDDAGSENRVLIFQ